MQKEIFDVHFFSLSISPIREVTFLGNMCEHLVLNDDAEEVRTEFLKLKEAES